MSSYRECGDAHKSTGAIASSRREDLLAGGGVVPGQGRVPNSTRLAIVMGEGQGDC